jgi:hypothetical protein
LLSGCGHYIVCIPAVSVVDLVMMLLIDALEVADRPMIVEIDKRLGCALDVALASAPFSDQTIIFIDAIYEAGFAER